MYAPNRRLHPSWLLAYLFFGITAGCIAAFWLPKPLFTSAVWPVSAILVTIIVLWRRYAWLAVLICIAGGLIGVWRAGNYRVALAPYERLIGQTLTCGAR